jgi:predicted Fe-Mo cluster-binding NifX family protein
MKIAIPTWQGRVSPVFDTAQRLLLVDAENGTEVARSEVALQHAFSPQRAARLKQLGVDVLICGAISRPLAGVIAASGIALMPFMSGETDQVLAAYLSKKLPSPQFMMPGCWAHEHGPGWGFGMGHGRGRGRGRGRGPFGRGGGHRQW